MTVDDPDLALQRLVSTLQEAAQLPDGDDGGRRAAKLQLKAVIDFLDNLVSTTRLEMNPHDPLFRLLAGLDDLESGITPLMLKARAKKGRPRSTIDDNFAKTSAAAAMNRLMWPKPGLSRQKAAEYVAKQIRHWDVLKTGRENVSKTGREIEFSWKTVAAWRDRLKAGSEVEDYDTTIYMALIQDVAERPRDQAVKALLLSQPLRKF